MSPSSRIGIRGIAFKHVEHGLSEARVRSPGALTGEVLQGAAGYVRLHRPLAVAQGRFFALELFEVCGLHSSRSLQRGGTNNQELFRAEGNSPANRPSRRASSGSQDRKKTRSGTATQARRTTRTRSPRITSESSSSSMSKTVREEPPL